LSKNQNVDFFSSVADTLSFTVLQYYMYSLSLSLSLTAPSFCFTSVFEHSSLYVWGDPDIDGRIILRGIFRKWEGVVGTGWSGLRIGKGGGHL
jgi:hypothetical protein